MRVAWYKVICMWMDGWMDGWMDDVQVCTGVCI